MFADVRPEPVQVLGAISVMLWAVFLVVCVKYVLFILKADANGEGVSRRVASVILVYSRAFIQVARTRDLFGKRFARSGQWSIVLPQSRLCWRNCLLRWCLRRASSLHVIARFQGTFALLTLLRRASECCV